MKKIIFLLLLVISVVITVNYFIEEPVDNKNLTTLDLPTKFVKSTYFSEYNLSDKFVIYIDFSKGMNSRRLWVVDNGKVIATSYTSHGSGSMSKRFLPPNKFSNKKGTNQSSLGIYRIIGIRSMNPPKSKHSCSCNSFVKTKVCNHYAKKFPLKGLESSNDNSLDRGIVIHTSHYVSEEKCKGNSNGCFVVSPDIFEILQKKKLLFVKKCYLVAMK